MISHNPGGELDLSVFKSGCRADLPHLFLTISHSCVSKIDCSCMSLSSARAKSNSLRGCPSEDPRDRIRALQEIPRSPTRNTINTSLSVCVCVCHDMCILMKYIDIVYISSVFRNFSHPFWCWERNCCIHRGDPALEWPVAQRIVISLVLSMPITWLNVQVFSFASVESSRIAHVRKSFVFPEAFFWFVFMASCQINTNKHAQWTSPPSGQGKKKK